LIGCTSEQNTTSDTCHGEGISDEVPLYRSRAAGKRVKICWCNDNRRKDRQMIQAAFGSIDRHVTQPRSTVRRRRWYGDDSPESWLELFVSYEEAAEIASGHPLIWLDVHGSAI
jgi:hypothetical protein